MRFLAFAALPLAALPALAIADEAAKAPAANAPPAKSPCQDAKLLQADPAAPAILGHLGKQPPAKQVLTVVRRVDGCDRPVIVRENVGK